MYFCRRKPHFVRIVIARDADATQNVPQLRFIVEQSQQRLAASAACADSEDVFCRRVESNNKQAAVEQDDA